MYVVDQMLHSRRPERVATVIGLEGAYVIPPLAEGHQRDLRFTAQFDSSSAEYMRAGIYYVAVQSYVAALAKELRERAAAAETADAIWAHGAITESSY